MGEVIIKMYRYTVQILSRSSIRCMCILLQIGGGYQKDVCAICSNMGGGGRQ